MQMHLYSTCAAIWTTLHIIAVILISLLAFISRASASLYHTYLYYLLTNEDYYQSVRKENGLQMVQNVCPGVLITCMEWVGTTLKFVDFMDKKYFFVLWLKKYFFLMGFNMGKFE